VDLAEDATARPYLRVAAVGGAAGFAALAVLMWHSTRPVAWERAIIDAVDGIPLPFRDFWIALFQPIAFTLLTFALGGAAAARGRRRLALAGIVGCLGAVLAAQVVFKPLVDRVRTHTVGVHPHVVEVGGRMFPSAHVTAAAALATFALLILGRRSRLTPFLIALPFVVGGAAVSLELHYPADVAGGLLLGPTFVYYAVAAARWVRERPPAAVSEGQSVANSQAIERPRGGYPASQRESE
jgi:membrane-associated phospholipid phosphatase